MSAADLLDLGGGQPKQGVVIRTKFILYIRPHALNLQPLEGKLMDCEEGGLQGLRTDMQGFETMRLGLAEAMPLYGAA